MNRRNLFQACAAGLAWLVGGKLPAVEKPIEHCTWHVCNYITVRNLSGHRLLPKRLVFWTKDRDGVTDKFLDGHGPAGVVDDSCPSDGYVTIQTYGACQISTTR